MNRRNFIFRSCTLAMVGVAGGLVGCSKGEDDPYNGGNGGGGGPRLTVNLNTDLKSVGSFKSQNNVVVVRTAEGNVASSFVALTSICTHEACTVAYQSGTNQFVCPCHGSIYTINGSVVQGPAPAPLARYTVSINGETLTVT